MSNFDFEHIKVYPELIMDVIIYVAVFVIVIILSKVLWTLKEERRLRKEYKVYEMMRNDEEE
ncbi:MAG: hypothetical protein E7327_09310 [Clostridiales bacterium]|nr:hypothetical protein [Clostridiales bacterium]